MRTVVQRVSEACVDIGGETVGRIGLGVVVFLGVGPDDGPEDVRYTADKVLHLRIFPDGGDKMNLSVVDIRGEVLVVSQFTLYGDCRKGRRPSYVGAAPPEKAQRLYQDFVSILRTSGLRVETGRFQEKMRVQLVNDGPVTLLMDSKKSF